VHYNGERKITRPIGNECRDMKIKDKYFVYLGGSHRAEGGWRDDFTAIVREQLAGENFTLVGINPFSRNIDETNSYIIVNRDMTILCDERLRYVVLKSVDSSGSLTTGTACEMILARSLNKPVIVLTEKYSDEHNPWVHPFTKHFATYVATNMEDAISYIKICIIEDRSVNSLTEDILAVNKYSFDSPDINPFDATK